MVYFYFDGDGIAG